MFKLILLSIFATAISSAIADDLVIQVQDKTPTNQVQNDYIGIQVDPVELIEIVRNRRTMMDKKLGEFGSTTIKIAGKTTNLIQLGDDSIEINSTKIDSCELNEIYRALKFSGNRIIFALPYDSTQWHPRDAMKLLLEFDDAETNDITWQLGTELHMASAVDYLDHLSALAAVVDAFNAKDSRRNWRVIGCDVTAECHENEARLYSELSSHLIDAISWTQSTFDELSKAKSDNLFTGRDVKPALRTVLNSRVPVWLSIKKQNELATKPHESNLEKTFEWARILGDAAQIGFSRVFAEIDRDDVRESTMNDYVNTLHKRLIGVDVLDATAKGEQPGTHVYTHCHRKTSGAFVIYAVNTAFNEVAIDVTIPPFKSGTEYSEYVLTENCANAKVRLNGIDIAENSLLIPSVKIRQIMKPIHLPMPPRSIVFWEFSHAKLNVCRNDNVTSDNAPLKLTKSSMENYLQELILNAIDAEQETRNKVCKNNRRRQSRSIGNSFGLHKSNRVLDKMYKSIDDMKRFQIRSPLAMKLNGLTKKTLKRKQRSADGFQRLIDRWEMRREQRARLFNKKFPLSKRKAGVGKKTIDSSRHEDSIIRETQSSSAPRSLKFYDIVEDEIDLETESPLVSSRRELKWKNEWPKSSALDVVDDELTQLIPKNAEGTDTVRKQLQKYFVPNVGKYVQLVKIPEPNRFDSSAEMNGLRRLRRAIDSRMNDEIERKVQNVAHSHDEQFLNALNDSEILKTIAKFVDDLKLKANKESNRTNESDDMQKKCKIMSKSLEQQCLSESFQPLLPLHNHKSGFIKKAIKPMKKFLATDDGKSNEQVRSKRSYSTDSSELRKYWIEHSNVIDHDDENGEKLMMKINISHPINVDVSSESLPMLLEKTGKIVRKITTKVIEQLQNMFKWFS